MTSSLGRGESIGTLYKIMCENNIQQSPDPDLDTSNVKSEACIMSRN